MSILSEVSQNINQMSADELRAHLLKLAEEKQTQRERQKQYNATPEAKEARKAYTQKRLEAIKANPEEYNKVREQRKAYMSRPEVKERQKAYRTRRNEAIKQALARAAELGINVKELGL